jgi:hypothetical protein
MTRVGHLARMAEIINAHRKLVGEPDSFGDYA